MKCPYCQNEMSPGYIPDGRQPVQWLPEGKKPSSFAFARAKDGVSLSNFFSLWNGYQATAYYCWQCGIVIAPVEKRM